MSSLLSPLNNPAFRWLFLAQLLSLLGTGLASVALALQAYQLNPTQAGFLLGALLATKMVAYVVLAPIAGAYARRLPRRRWLMSLNLCRALVVALMPFATDVWQLFVLIFLLNAFAAGFTPVYQALLPDLIEDEQQYTQALSLSRFLMEVEAFLSPVLAAALLLTGSWPLLFELNAVGFLLAAGCIAVAAIPMAGPSERNGSIWQQVSFGVRSYLKTPRLRAALALQLALAMGGAMVIVNTVVYVRQVLRLEQVDVPILMSAAGAGSMIMALMLPRLLQRWRDRQLMFCGGLLFIVALALGASLASYLLMVLVWVGIGVASSLVMIPVGRVIRSSCAQGDRDDYFAANFALSHGMWLLGYLFAGASAALWGLAVSFIVLALCSALAVTYAWYQWRPDEADLLWHRHDEMTHLHPHVHDEHHQHSHEGWEGPEPHVHPHYHPAQLHRHRFVIDEHHLHWPKN